MTERTYGEILDAIRDIVKEHEKVVRWSYGADLDEKIRHVLRHYQDDTTNHLVAIKHFRDDVITWLRAMAIVADMTSQAATHAEKNARLRGMVEVVESAIKKLRDREIDFNMTWWQWPDVFRSDYPTVHYVRRIHELEAQIKELEEQLKGEGCK